MTRFVGVASVVVLLAAVPAPPAAADDTPPAEKTRTQADWTGGDWVGGWLSSLLGTGLETICLLRMAQVATPQCHAPQQQNPKRKRQ